MAAIKQTAALDLAAHDAGEARDAIRAELSVNPSNSRKVYAALAYKVWCLLVERRFDEEIRDWHDLIHGVKAYVRKSDAAAAERLSALGDLLRESISLAETSPAREVAQRPRANQILRALAKSRNFVARRALLDQLDIGSSHLSNVLTQLLAHALVDRREDGKEAKYRITNLGRQLIGADVIREEEANLSDRYEGLAARVQQADLTLSGRRQQTLSTIPETVMETVSEELKELMTSRSHSAAGWEMIIKPTGHYLLPTMVEAGHPFSLRKTSRIVEKDGAS